MFRNMHLKNLDLEFLHRLWEHINHQCFFQIGFATSLLKAVRLIKPMLSTTSNVGDNLQCDKSKSKMQET